MKLIVGTANLARAYGQNSSYLAIEQYRQIVDSERGNSCFATDTSPDYGEAELICNEILSAGSQVYSKIRYNGSTGRFAQSALKPDLTKITLVHNWDELSKSDRRKALYSLEKRARRGVIGGIGFSNYREFCEDELLSRFPSLYVQTPLNALDQTNLERIGEIKENFPNVTVLARSVFLQGAMMSMETKPVMHEHPDLGRFKQACLELNLPILRVALEFVRAQSCVDGLVIGVRGIQDWLEIKKEIFAPRLNGLEGFNWRSLRSLDQGLVDPRKWK